MKIQRVVITEDAIQITYEHDHKEKTDGNMPVHAIKERDAAISSLLRRWADILDNKTYDSVGFASDARTVRRDQLSIKEVS